MTLHTRIWLDGTIEGEKAFGLSLAALMTAAGRADEIPTAQTQRRNRAQHDSISTVIGQGLPGVVDCDFRTDGPLASEDVWNTEYEDDHYLDQRACYVELGWDTAYSYNARGLGCSELHGLALINLWKSLPEGVTMRWQNEFTGDVFDGLDGLDSFLSDGIKAQDWFVNEAAPAIAASIASA